MAAAGISVVDWEDLAGDDRVHLRQTFEKRVFPILTPLSVDPAHPFPYISDLSLNLAVVARDPSTQVRRFARVKVPPNIARLQPLPDGERFIPQEQVIAANLDMLFPGMEIVAVHPFRVTRDLDLDLEIDEADDLLAAIESILRQRERSPEAVRLEVHGSMPKAVRKLIEEELHVDPSDVYVTRSMLGMTDLVELTKLDRPDLKFEPWTGITQPRLQQVASGKRDIFSVIAEGDVLVHHPYDAFSTSVEQFVSQAARDPRGLGDQADPVPDVGRGQPDRPRARARRRVRQADRGAGRAEGAVRRGGQHQVGARARAGRRPRRVRRGRVEDPREDARWSSARRPARSAGTATSAPGTTTR